MCFSAWWAPLSWQLSGNRCGTLDCIGCRAQGPNGKRPRITWGAWITRRSLYAPASAHRDVVAPQAWLGRKKGRIGLQPQPLQQRGVER
jgi:hypothetical protein